jgi:hypothetical protein
MSGFGIDLDGVVSMPRRRRTETAGIPHHVLNRACRRAALFANRDDYGMFLDVLNDATARFAIRILGLAPPLHM